MSNYVFWVLMVCTNHTDCDFSPFRLDSQVQCEYIKTHTINKIYNHILKDNNEKALERLKQEISIECIPSSELGSQ